jgi:hypothetical protein
MAAPAVAAPHGQRMLLDDLMPTYDVAERHRTRVRAAPEQVFDALQTADLAEGPATRMLFLVRALPAALVLVVRSPGAAAEVWRERVTEVRHGLRLVDFERFGFRIVAKRPGEEVVVGLLGRFWTPGGGLVTELSVSDFAAGPPAGHALAGWNFSVAPAPDGGTELRTETRVRCAPDALLAFRAYWLLVRPGSGIIRRSMLRSVRREAERSRSATPGGTT